MICGYTKESEIVAGGKKSFFLFSDKNRIFDFGYHLLRNAAVFLPVES